ncbi:unnamed protein product [Pleuronectes platessa]|uniref:Uncharacterized protein n=1 Tax=Pleuronectes platessa TaxID=8262 RepID=A0A9N7VKE8_PLEPL|nr:unnamed protein product [Pleuronectes platessa]
MLVHGAHLMCLLPGLTPASSAAQLLKVIGQQQRQCYYTPEASGPEPERRGPSSLSLSVNNSPSQRPAPCYSWPFLTSFKASKLIREPKQNLGNSVRSSESLGEARVLDASLLGYG